MMMCSVCKKNVAVIFTNKIVDGKQEMVGLCLNCAKKLGLSPMTQMFKNADISEDDLENLNSQMMNLFENNPGILNGALSGMMGNENNKEPDEQNKEDNEQIKKSVSEGRENNAGNTQKKHKKRKYLDTYGTNLTERAKIGKVDKVIGRNKEIDRVIQILNRRTKNNPILIGEPGVGKTAIAEGLAVRIVQREVPLKLYNSEVYLLELTSIVAGTQFRGQFEARMKSIINEVKSCGNIILVIDEIHNIIGAGNAENGAMNAANILKPELAKGDIQIIGATTTEEYKKYIEKDSALARRFQPVFVDEPTISESIEILKGIKGYYEDFHKVKIPDKVIEEAVKLSDRYINDRFLPDKAIDVIDEAGSRANLRNKGLVEVKSLKDNLKELEVNINKYVEAADYEKAAEAKTNECKLKNQIDEFEKKSTNIEITTDDVASVIEAWTKIPVQKITQIEAEKLLNLEDRLHKKVIGQNEAVSSLSRAIRRNRSGFKKLKKPSSFIFVGPTGVGKTELVKAVASELFENSDAFIRIDMSEYMEKYSVSKLIGAPPGYVGYDEGGQLTDKVRKNPYSVILLDEIEKAHPDVFNILLQILDDGRLTDSQGRTVHFENTIIVMTSNIGTNLKSNGIGFQKDNYESLSEKVKDSLRETFKPEFLNRIDETIVFTELSKDELRQIVDLMLKEIFSEAAEKHISLEVSDDVKEFILSKGYSTKYGARPLRRTIQRYIEDELAELYLKGMLKPGTNVKIEMKDGKVTFN